MRGFEPAIGSKYIYGAYVVPTGGGLKVQRVDTVGSVVSLTTSPAGSSTDIVACQLATVSGVIVAAVSSTSAGHSQLYYSSDSGATWTAQAAITFSSAVGFWILASSPGGQVVGIPCTARPNYVASANGTTWTAQAALTTLLGVTEAPTTLCWGDDGTGTGCWVLSTFDGTNTAFYRSYDGINWTAFASTWPHTLVADQMVNISDARILVALVDEAPARVVYSLDGGATWSGCRLEAPIVSVVSSLPTGHKLAAGPNQAAIACGALWIPSLAIGDPGGIGTP